MNLTPADIYNELTKNYQSDFPLITEFLAQVEGPVLEIGAGSGRLLPLYEGREIHLLENNPQMLELLRAKVKDRPAVTLVESCGQNMPFEDGHFAGVIVAFNTLLEIRPISFALNEAVRILKPGGQIYILIENSLNTRPVSAKPRSVHVGGKDLGVRISRYPYPRFGPRTLATEIEVTDVRGTERTQTLQTMLTGDELIGMLKALAVEPIRVVGDYTGGAFESSTSHICGVFGKKSERPLPVSAVARFYDGLAPKYAAVYEDLDYQVPARLKNLASSFLTRGSFPKVLDLGCGDGAIAGHLKRIESTASFFGIDGSSEMIRMARQRGLYAGLAVHDLNAGVPVLEDGFFDVIVCAGLSEFIVNAPLFISQVRRILTSTGQLWMTFELAPITGAKKLDNYDFAKHVYAEKDVREWLEKNQFKIISCETFSAYESKTLNGPVPYILVQAEACT